MQTTPAAEIRAPWPDEMERLTHFLPAALLFDPDPFLRIAVRGRVERIVGAVSLTLRPVARTGAAWMTFRVEPDNDDVGSIVRDLVLEAVRFAWVSGAVRISLGAALDENSRLIPVLQEVGFHIESAQEVWEIDSRLIWKRLDSLYTRAKAAGWIPPETELLSLQPALIPPVRDFLVAHVPRTASILAMQSTGYKPEHSLALIVSGEVKGVLLCRVEGRVAVISLRAVAPGIAWRNCLGQSFPTTCIGPLGTWLRCGG